MSVLVKWRYVDQLFPQKYPRLPIMAASGCEEYITSSRSFNSVGYNGNTEIGCILRNSLLMQQAVTAMFISSYLLFFNGLCAIIPLSDRIVNAFVKYDR